MLRDYTGATVRKGLSEQAVDLEAESCKTAEEQSVVQNACGNGVCEGLRQECD